LKPREKQRIACDTRRGPPTSFKYKNLIYYQIVDNWAQDLTQVDFPWKVYAITDKVTWMFLQGQGLAETRALPSSSLVNMAVFVNSFNTVLDFGLTVVMTPYFHTTTKLSSS
jgi:hypothetical protein